MPEEQYGIEHVEAFIEDVKSYVDAYNAAMQDDGKITIRDYRHFIMPLLGIGDMIDHAKHVPDEWADLSQAEADRLRSKYGELLDDPDFVMTIDGALRFSSGMYRLFSKRATNGG